MRTLWTTLEIVPLEMKTYVEVPAVVKVVVLGLVLRTARKRLTEQEYVYWTRRHARILKKKQ